MAASVTSVASKDDQERNWKLLFNKILVQDKTALLFLLGSDERQCLIAIQSLLLDSSSFGNFISSWKYSGSSNPLEHDMKLCDALFLLKQFSLMSRFGACKHTYQMHGKLNQLRVFLFSIYDELNCDEADNFCSLFRQPNLQDSETKSGCIELVMLQLIQARKISLQDMSVLKAALQRILRRDLCQFVDIEVKKHVPVHPVTVNSALSDEYYDMNSYPCGICVIFNQRNFWQEENPYFSAVVHPGKLDDRIGTDIDRDSLAETFKMLGFQIKLFENRTHLEILHDLDDIAREEKLLNCLVVCILSHGTQGQIMGSNSVPVDLNEMKMKFRGTVCPALIGKPKIFIIQACQGSIKQASAAACPKNSRIQHDGPAIYSVPEYHDVYEMYSTVPGYLSFRNTISGSWFINTLCYYLKEKGHLCDIERVATYVNRWVASAEAHEDGEIKKQMPQFTSCLRKGLRFKRHIDGFVEAIVDKLEKEFLDNLVGYFVVSDYGKTRPVIQRLVLGS